MLQRVWYLAARKQPPLKITCITIYCSKLVGAMQNRGRFVCSFIFLNKDITVIQVSVSFHSFCLENNFNVGGCYICLTPSRANVSAGGGGGGYLRECVLGEIIIINNNEFLSAPNLTDKAINVTANSTMAHQNQNVTGNRKMITPKVTATPETQKYMPALAPVTSCNKSSP